MMATITTSIRPSVRGLGEIALRFRNLDAMPTFYEAALGLPLPSHDLAITFRLSL